MSAFLAHHSALSLALMAAAAFIAGSARGFAGFGGALIFVPLASAITGPLIAAPVLLIIDAVAAAPLIPEAWRTGHGRDVTNVVLGSLAGAPAGAFALIHLAPTAVRWGIACLALAMLGLLGSGWRYKARAHMRAAVGVGLLAGFLNGLAQMGGPPIVAYWLGGSIPARTARANFILFFAASTVVTTISYIAGGILTFPVFAFAAVAGPAYGLGLYFGTRIFSVADEKFFRRICYGLIAIAAVIGLPVWYGVREFFLR